jgi:hypothetical protein
MLDSLPSFPDTAVAGAVPPGPTFIVYVVPCLKRNAPVIIAPAPPPPPNLTPPDPPPPTTNTLTFVSRSNVIEFVPVVDVKLKYAFFVALIVCRVPVAPLCTMFTHVPPVFAFGDAQVG